MAQKWQPISQTFKTNANFATKEWFLVKYTSDTDIDLCGDGDLPFGALTNNVGASNTDTKYVDVQTGGIIKVVCGSAITGGTLVASDASGEAVPAIDNDFAFGQALHGAADGELVSVQFGISHYDIA